ncbi:MAG: choice-of-anchor L domain-containing protein [Bacteroidota bacterium]
MKHINYFFLVLSFIGFTSIAQIQVNTTLNDNDLIQTLAGNGVAISNINMNCHETAYGQFTNDSSLNLGQGVILTSGGISFAPGPNNTISAGTHNNNGPSELLSQLNGDKTFDACEVTFDIIPDGDNLAFTLVFGSEEYHEYVNDEYNDLIGIFITDPIDDLTYNIAFVPGTNEQPVGVNSINNGVSSLCQSNGNQASNPEFFIDNCEGLDVQYDGFTVVLTAEANNLFPVVAGQSYAVTIAIADAEDPIYDSGLFLKEGGIYSCTTTSAYFHFENDEGTPETEFCLGENIFLNGSASEGEDQYKLDISRTLLPNGPTEDYSTVGWLSGMVETINLTTLFQQESIPLEIGYEYNVTLTVSDSICEQLDYVSHSFTVLSNQGLSAFHFENEQGNQQDEFCLGETIYLNGSSSEGEEEYKLDVSRTNGGATQDFSAGGWMPGIIEIIDLTAIFDDNFIPLELGYEYFVTLTIRNLPCLEETSVTHSFTLLSAEGIAAFHFEDELGNEQTEFCITQPVYLNGNASVGDDEYLIGVSTFNTETSVTVDYSNIGWNTGPTSVFNLTDLLIANEVPIEQELRYDITLSIRDLPCITETSVQHSFIYGAEPLAAFNFENDLGEPQEVFCDGEDVYLDGTASEGELYYTIIASCRVINTTGNFNPVSTLPATQSMIGTLNISDLFANFGNPNHTFQAGYEYEIELVVGNDCGSNSVSHVFQMIDDASLDPSFSLTPSAGLSTGIPVTATQYELHEDLMAVHDWYVFYTPNNGSGPYTLERFLLDEPTITFRPPWVGFYIVVHRVSNPCGETCYGQVLYIGSPWEQFNCEAVTVCSEVDCSIIESLVEQATCQGDECEKIVEISPNPSNGELYINVSNTTSYEVEILDIYGNRLFNDSFGNSKIRIDLQHQRTGLYFVRVLENGKLIDVKTWIKE